MKIPELAMPVVEVLRRDVKKPDKRDLITNSFPCRFVGGYCPMGLHDQSYDRAPVDSADFADGSCAEPEVIEFMVWWDGLKTKEAAREAIDLIWP